LYLIDSLYIYIFEKQLTIYKISETGKEVKHYGVKVAQDRMSTLFLKNIEQI